MFSGPGQTFLVSLFIPHMRETFSMNQTEIAGVYSLATLISAAILPFMGNLLDRFHLGKFTIGAGVLLALGCFVLSLSPGWIFLIIGFLLIRNLGQGTLCMVSSTTMARVFGSNRGKAISIANLGYPLGESFFPIAVSTWILYFNWRSGWVFLGVLVLLFFLPAVFFLLRKNRYETTKKALEKDEKVEAEISQALHEAVHWSLKDVLKDWRFYFLTTAALVTPAFLTALFFHQAALASWKGWNIQVVASAFIAFAISRAIFSFFIGPFIDKFSARKIFPFSLIPLALGLVFLVTNSSVFWVFIYLASAGMTMGTSMNAGNALFAELYGTKKLGSIKGLLSFFIVFSTAATPVVMGRFLDLKINLDFVLWGMVLLTIFGVLLSWIACQKKVVSR